MDTKAQAIKDAFLPEAEKLVAAMMERMPDGEAQTAKDALWASALTRTIEMMRENEDDDYWVGHVTDAPLHVDVTWTALAKKIVMYDMQQLVMRESR